MKKLIRLFFLAIVSWGFCLSLAAQSAPPIVDDPGTAAYRQVADSSIGYISGKLGRPLKAKVSLKLETIDYAGQAGTLPYNAAGKTPYLNDDGSESNIPKLPAAQRPKFGAMTECRISLTPNAQKLDPHSKEIRSTLTHEIFHCFTIDLIGMDENLDLPKWIKEGGASWVGEDYVGGSTIPDLQKGWTKYLTQEVGLFDRSYDGMGFFAHLQNSGINPWDVFDKIIVLGKSDLAFQKILNEGGSQFLETWASGLSRSPGLGGMWDTKGPGITNEKRDRTIVSISPGSPFSNQIPPVTQRLYQITLPTGKIISVNLSGYGTWHWGGDGGANLPIQNSWTKQYCVGASCKCDDGSQPTGVESAPTHQVILAMTGTKTPADVNITAADNPCQKPPKSPGNGNGNGSTSGGGKPSGTKEGSSYGDPHIITLDGTRYSFQTVGEFVLVKSIDGEFEVQTRQAPVPNQELSLNTAVAMRLGNDRLAMYAQNDSGPEAPVILRLNGQPITVSDKPYALSSGSISRSGDRTYTVQWSKGEQVVLRLTTFGQLKFINVTVSVADNQSDRFSGLLGNSNGNGQDDLQTRSGKVIPVQSSYGNVTQALSNLLPTPIPLSRLETAYMEQLHQEFGNSWRLQPTESLFDYASGETTETFTDRRFPKAYRGLNALLPNQIQSAQNICRTAGVSDPLMEGCIFDVGMTGSASFAEAATQALTRTVVNHVLDRAVEEVQKQIPLPIPRSWFPF
jgi:hypothetical protein